MSVHAAVLPHLATQTEASHQTLFKKNETSVSDGIELREMRLSTLPTATELGLFADHYFQDRFQLANQLGSGVSSKIAVVLDVEDLKFCVCKFVHCPRSLVEHEVVIIHLLAHTEIIRVYKIYPVNHKKGTVFAVVMENLGPDWCDLLVFIAHYLMITASQARIVFRNVVAAVEFMHEKGFTHNDLKRNSD
jgi:serine/threonine protein kinase